MCGYAYLRIVTILSKNAKAKASDYANLIKWNAKLDGARLIRPDLKDACDAYLKLSIRSRKRNGHRL
jgi:DNA integrity scanning protein DisA with diadenylate cyclase activity